MTLLCQMLSTKPEERPTAEEIVEETLKNKRKNEPELILPDDVNKFLDFQEQFVALLPKISYQYLGSTTTFEQWTRELSERTAGLRKQAGDRERKSQRLSKKRNHASERVQDIRKQAGEGQHGSERLSVEKKIACLARQTGRSEGSVVDVVDYIDKLSNLLMWLQDPMTSEDLAQACSLLVNIEDFARTKNK